jgi:hypothetical protein
MTLAEILLVVFGWFLVAVTVAALWVGVRRRMNPRRSESIADKCRRIFEEVSREQRLEREKTEAACNCAFCVSRTRFPHLAISAATIATLQESALYVGAYGQRAMALEAEYGTSEGIGALHYIVCDAPTWHRYVWPALQQAQAAGRPA